MTVADPIVHAFDGLASRVDATGFRTVGFTSALLGEGVSTIALGTALALAALRQEKVLLVDANWIRPSLTADARAASRRGLAEVLRRQALPGGLVVPTDQPRLSFLPAGAKDGTPPELDAALREFLGGALSRFDTVVVDLPAALSGDSAITAWAAALQQFFVVARSGVTPLAALRRAIAEIAADDPQIVLNRVPPTTSERSARPQVITE